jgi:hypothetical protein
MMRHPQRVARHAAVTRRRAVDVTDGRCLPASVSYHGCSWRGWKRSASSGRPDDFKSAVIQALFGSRRIDFLAAREKEVKLGARPFAQVPADGWRRRGSVPDKFLLIPCGGGSRPRPPVAEVSAGAARRPIADARIRVDTEEWAERAPVRSENSYR